MDPEPTFERALEQLERIVDDLERGESELSTALKKYEQGVALLGRCQAALEQADRSVALLTGVDAQGNPLTAPFDATATGTAPAPAPTPEDAPARRPRKRRPASQADPSDDESIPF